MKQVSISSKIDMVFWRVLDNWNKTEYGLKFKHV